MPSDRPNFSTFFIFHPMKLKIGTGDTHSQNCGPKSRYQYENSTFVLFLCVFVAPSLKEKVTMAIRKDQSITCKLKNLANDYLRKVTKFQGYSFCRVWVCPDWLAEEHYYSGRAGSSWWFAYDAVKAK